MRGSIKLLLNKASRDTSSGQFIPEIDGLRFIAILSVVLFHLNWFIASKTGRGETCDPVTGFLSHGYIGVQLFFVLSGFVISLPFARGHLLGRPVPSLRQYLLRRLTRLEPPYLVNLLFRFALLPVATGASAAALLPHLLASGAYLHNLVYGCESSVNFVAWSLEVELQFYLLAPLLAPLFGISSKRRRRTLLVALILICSALAYATAGFPRCALSLVGSGQYFLTGFLVADLYIADWGEAPEKSRLWDLFSLAGWGAVSLLPYWGKTGELFLACAVFVAYLGAFRGSWSNRFFRIRGIYLIGGMCYSIYLYHYSVISALGRPLLRLGLLGRLPASLELAAAALVVLPATLLASALLFVLIEKPCMKRDWHRGLASRCRSALRGSGVISSP